MERDDWLGNGLAHYVRCSRSGQFIASWFNCANSVAITLCS